MTLLQLIDRLLRKRPAVFVGPCDNYMLFNGTSGSGGFDLIGHLCEDSKLPITEYMTYDEMKLAALVSVSSNSYFINSGSRHNRGVAGMEGTFQPDGVIVGQVGARFHKPEKMEWQDCIITEDQNKKENGYGSEISIKHCLVSEWANLWNVEYLPT